MTPGVNFIENLYIFHCTVIDMKIIMKINITYEIFNSILVSKGKRKITDR